MASSSSNSWAFSWWVALRYLWSSRAEASITVITGIAIIGVAIGVITLNMVMAVMTGFQTELKSKILGADAHITVRNLSGTVENWESLLQVIRDVQGVESVSPYTYSQALLQTKQGATGLLIRGLKEGTAAATQLGSYLDDPPRLRGMFESVVEKVTDPLRGGTRDVKLPGIAVGEELAKRFNLFEGAVVTLLAPQTTATPFGLTPRFRRFRVAAVYSSGLVEYESGLAYTSLEEAQSFFRLGADVSALEVRVRDVDSAPSVARAIVDAVGSTRQGFYTRDWTEVNEAFFEAFKLEKRVYFIVLLLIIVMASFSIVSSLIMVVLEKRKDIAILKTLGASSGSIAAVFNIQGAVIGGVGVFLGTVGGLLGSIALDTYGFPIDQRIFQMSTLPVKIVPLNFALVAISAFAICCLATVYPSRRAASLQPSDVLRYE
jgi:lipoprotein-releasing system permease protein